MHMLGVGEVTHCLTKHGDSVVPSLVSALGYCWICAIGPEVGFVGGCMEFLGEVGFGHNHAFAFDQGDSCVKMQFCRVWQVFH